MKTLLIVDDEAMVRQSFMDYFEDHLWRPIAATSGEEALALLEQTSPHAAIVDIRLGGMDGNAFIRQAYRESPQMGFVICTGSPQYEVPPDVCALPTVSERVFTKPVLDMGSLEDELRRLIAQIAAY